MTIETISEQRCFGGMQGFYRHASSETAGTMKFGVFRPPQAAKRKVPTTYAYVRLAMGAPGLARLDDEGGRYAGIPAYAAHFERMGVKPVDTAIAATSAEGIKRALAAWDGAVDEVVLRAITAKDTVEDHLTLVRAAG